MKRSWQHLHSPHLVFFHLQLGPLQRCVKTPLRDVYPWDHPSPWLTHNKGKHYGVPWDIPTHDASVWAGFYSSHFLSVHFNSIQYKYYCNKYGTTDRPNVAQASLTVEWSGNNADFPHPIHCSPALSLPPSLFLYMNISRQERGEEKEREEGGREGEKEREREREGEREGEGER